jgi:hypothetical protein
MIGCPSHLAAAPGRGLLCFTHNLVITGIPRGGTSLLCNLIHRYGNCVVINEPVEVTEAFDRNQRPENLPQLYKDIRFAVQRGVPIKNKLRDGEVVQDTKLEYTIGDYCPQVESNDFVLATKDTLAYLTNLELIHCLLPDARVAACVRDPIQSHHGRRASCTCERLCSRRCFLKSIPPCCCPVESVQS